MWVKKGLIYRHSALQPTPWVKPDGTIRMFLGFRDTLGVGRIGYIDVSGTNPAKILKVTKKPVLDVGKPGAFDDNGVAPCAVVPRGKKLFLYYAGYQLVHHVRFTAFSGLAVSSDGGQSFVRYAHVPILERTHEEFLFRAIHSMLYDKSRKKWQVWYGAGNHFIQGKRKTLPSYDIRYMESEDGIHFPDRGIPCKLMKTGEYRVGRPYVLRTAKGYEMYFGYSTPTVPYRLTYATSRDGIHWKREDHALGLKYKKGEFDSRMSAFPAVVTVGTKTYLFYNGNEYGKMGVGYAIQTSGDRK